MSKIYQLIQKHHSANKGFVIFKEPNHKELHYLSGTNNLEATEGFAFFPFTNSDQSPCFIDKQEQITFTDLNKFWESQNINGIDGDGILENKQQISSTSFNAYQEAFSKIKAVIASGNISKAILSKINNHAFNLKDIDDLFELITSKYENAFCYIFYHNTTGIWIGASPEVILKQDGDLFETTSLAGTKSDINALWGPKELDEQKIVTEYIYNNLIHKVSSINVGELKTVKAGEVYHLKQTITFKRTKDKLTKQALFDLTNLLHPTPAIAGFPKKESLDVINEVENHDRKYYCGFLGLVENQKSELYVNLRCAEVTQNAIYLYVGGGITMDSNCDNEWLECERKAKTISDLL